MNYEDWKKELSCVLDKKDFELEKIPVIIKRCPKCNSLSLEFNAKTGRIYCSKCGFEEWFKMMPP